MQVIVLMSGSTTKFPLGFYSSNPNGNDATANAQFEENYDNFVSVMGNARPQFMDSFVDFHQDPTQWAANASWSAWSWAQTGAAYVGPTSGTIPVIGVPMATNAAGWSNVDTFYQQIIAGNYDSAYAGIVDAWASQGYKTMDLRLGYEFNGNFMSWAPGNSSSPTANADFVKAWQHVADIVHAEGVKQGVTVNTVWNPADINWTGTSVLSLYPGDKYVDIIGTDSYSPEYSRDSTNWQASNSGAIVSTSGTASAAQQAINNAHFWTYSNATQWNPTGEAGAGWSMQQAIELAKETGKPLGIAETGSAQDPAFPTWLAQELSQPGAPKVAFVNIWSTDQSDGNWGFINGENTAVGKAWSQAFGAGSASNANGPAVASAPLDTVPGSVGSVAIAAGNATWSSTLPGAVASVPVTTAPSSTLPGSVASVPVATAPSPVAFGSGADTVSLQLSEDAYQGDAQVSFSVDGVLLGTGTITASHASGQSQTVSLAGNWGAGQHTVTANFLNDAYAGTAATDRNAYVSAASYDGVALSGASLSLLSAGPQSLTVGTAIPSVVAVGAGAHTIALKVSEDAYQGDAQFTVSVDGTQVGGTLTAQASHAAGQDQTFDIAGNFADGTHTVSVNFLNDAYAGTPTTDRNLYVDGAGIDGVSQASGTLSLLSAGSQSLTVLQQDTLVLQMSEDAYQGDAQFTVSVDGKQVGGTRVATASHAAGQSQAVTLTGDWGLGQHSVAVSFLNDAYAGSPTTDRNLYVAGATYDGSAAGSGSLTFLSNGTQSLAMVSATTYSPAAAGGSITTLGRDTVNLGSGAATVSAMGPSVSVSGSTGSLNFIANGGNDTVSAGAGASTLTGRGGPLTFFEGSGASTLTAGLGKVTIDLVNGKAGGSLLVSNFVPGTDVVHLQGYSGTGIQSQTVTGGSAQFVFTDGTKLILAGVPTTTPAHPIFG